MESENTKRPFASDLPEDLAIRLLLRSEKGDLENQSSTSDKSKDSQSNGSKKSFKNTSKDNNSKPKMKLTIKE